jgi:hypothetical protein
LLDHARIDSMSTPSTVYGDGDNLQAHIIDSRYREASQGRVCIDRMSDLTTHSTSTISSGTQVWAKTHAFVSEHVRPD